MAQKSPPTGVIVFVILTVAALIATFVILASIGDDVPSKLSPATQSAPGN